MSTTTNFYNDTPVYASTSALSAVDTSVVTDGVAFQNGALAIVTGTGMYQWLKDGLSTVNGTTVLAATGGGQWVSYTSEGAAYLIMSDDNIIDGSQIQISGADIALTTGRVFVGVNSVATATTLTSGQILVGNGSSAATAVSVTGDVTLSNAGVTAIASGAIVNADVNASAAIDYSKLATLASGNVLVGSAGGVATSVAMSGDATIAASGALTIASNAVTTAKILNSNVTLAKLASGITPSHVVKFAAQVANGGGSATIAINVPGVLTTDIVSACVQASTNAVSVQKVTPTADTVTVILSADPGASTIIAYSVLRAAA